MGLRRLGAAAVFFWLAAFATASCQAADSVAGEERIRVEPSRLLVYDTFPMAGGEIAVYPLEAGPSRFTKLRVTTGRAAGVSVLLLDKDNYLLFKEQGSYSPMHTRAETIRNMRFLFFEIPGEGSYYLVLRSEGRRAPRDVTVFASGLYDRIPPEKKELLAAYRDFYSTIRKYFVFPDFGITVGGCGEENAFSSPDIFICDEFLVNLPPRNLPDYAVWVAFHELGHNLLKAWGHSGWNDEDTADEFGAVLISVTPYRQRLLDAVTGLTGEKAWLADRLHDRRKSILMERARRAVEWLSSPDPLLARWHDVLTPHLRRVETTPGTGP